MVVDLGIGLILLALGLAAPAWLGSYDLTFLMQVALMVGLGHSWNLFSGFTGYVSFGHAAFFGIGAYTGSLLILAGLPWYLAVAGAGMTALLLSLPLGLLTLRLRGPYFAIAMLGLNELCRIVATLWVSLTRGGDGIPLPPDLLPSLTTNYFTLLAFAFTTTLLVGAIRHHRFGLELLAIREDEEAAEMSGVQTTRCKIIAFTLSACFPGAIGAVYAFYTSFIDPHSVFSPEWNIQMIVMVMVGGGGRLWGPVIGAGLVMGLRELLWARFPAIHAAVMGILLISIVLFLPCGVLSLFQRRPTQRSDLHPTRGESPPA